MEIKLFSLIKDEPALFADDKRLISECANAFTSENEKFKNFVSAKRMLLAVSQSLRSADVVIIAVQAAAYNTAKKMICSALGLELQKNEKVYVDLLPSKESGLISQNSLLNHSSFPVGANIFATEDLKNCGFAVSSGAQSIIVIPLDYVKTSEVVFGSLYDYIGEFAGVENKKDLSRLKRFRAAQRLLSALKKSNTKMAFTALGGVSIIKENLRLVDEHQEFMTLGDGPQAKANMQDAKNYIIKAAQQTREEKACDFAGAVSSPFASNVDNSVFIFYAIASRDDTTVVKLYAKEDESPKRFTAIATEKMIETAGSIVLNKFYLSNQNKMTKADRNLRQTISTITAFAIGGSAAICAILALILGGGQ